MYKNIPFALLLSSALPAFANSTYIGVDYFHSKIDISDKKAKPSLAGLKVGTEIYKQVSIEFEHLVGSGTDEIYNLEFELEKSSSVYLVLNSGNKNGLGMDASIGYAKNKLTVTGPENTYNGTDEYDGFSWGISIYQHLPQFENAQIKLGYKSLYDDEHISISGFTLGFNYYF